MGVACIIVLVLLQVFIVGMVLTGTRDQDTTVQRMDSTRAFYAAEGVMNMAIREIVSYADDDDDGQTGGISNDSNPANDPSVSDARSVGVRVDGSGVTTITADGRSGSCRRRVVATIGDGTVAGRRVIYSQWPNQIPQVRVWTGSTWGAPTATQDFGAKQYWALIRRCPIRQEVLIACSTQGDDLVASVETGSTWGNLLNASNNIGTINSRPFAIAYEQTSGRAMIAYRNANNASIFYRIWNGSTWSSESSTSSPLTGNPTFIKLVPKPSTNEMMLYVLDTNNAIAAMVWDGTSFSNKVTLETSAPSSSVECVDAAYEVGTGRCMVIWSRAGRNDPRYIIWNGTSWSATTVMADAGAIPQWFHLASDKASNKLMLGMSDSANHVSAAIWNGSSWSSYLQVETSAATLGSRCFDVAFEPKGTRGMIVYGNSSSTLPRYRTYDGSAWSAQLTAGSMPGSPFLVQLTPSGGGREVMVLMNCTGGQNRLEFMRWNGSSFVNVQELEANVSGPSGAEVFMVPDEPPMNVPQVVVNWTESSPP